MYSTKSFLIFHNYFKTLKYELVIVTKVSKQIAKVLSLGETNVSGNSFFSRRISNKYKNIMSSAYFLHNIDIL